MCICEDNDYKEIIMETILDRLKKYFETTSTEQVQEDWNKTEIYDQVNSPSAHFFFSESRKLLQVPIQQKLPPETMINNFKRSRLIYYMRRFFY